MTVQNNFSKVLELGIEPETEIDFNITAKCCKSFSKFKRGRLCKLTLTIKSSPFHEIRPKRNCYFLQSCKIKKF